MDPVLFKPFRYDAVVFIDTDQALNNVLSNTGLSGGSVTDLPLSAFTQHTNNKEQLNTLLYKTGVSNYIGNRLIYLSAGSTTSDYVSGVLVTPENPWRNLLNRFNPTVNLTTTGNYKTREQLGGTKLPQNIAVLNYMSVKPRPRLLSEKLTPDQLYVLADPELYGAGQGTDHVDREVLFDYEENVTWIRGNPVNIGQAGRIIITDKLPLFYNYTSYEQSNTIPKYGLSKYTDNFDFFNGSISGDMWSNQDVYTLPEANKFDINERQSNLLVDICDSPYNWKTDIYGNQFMLYKIGTQRPKKTAGGSDTDGDGRDDTFDSGVGEPDYGNYDGGIDGVYDGDSSGEIDFGDNIGVDQDDGGFDPGTGECPPCIENGQPYNPGRDEDGNCIPCSTEDDSTTVDPTESQLPLADCQYFLYGGDSFAPSNSGNNLDLAYRYSTSRYTAPQAYTTAGAVSSITDGGWRCVLNDTDDHNENQFEQTSAGASKNVYSLNGFFDKAYYNSNSSSFDPDSSTKVGWIPNYTRRVADVESGSETHRFPLIQFNDISNLSEGNWKWTFTFSSLLDDGIQNRVKDYERFKLQYDHAYTQNLPDVQRRHEADGKITYTIADGGWHDFSSGWNAEDFSFFRSQCDRASYILALYGTTGRPDFGEHLFACRMFDITSDDKFMEAVKDLAYDKNDTTTDPRTGEVKENPNGYAAELRYKRYRGPLNALYLRNPIEWSEAAEGKYQKNIQFWGTKTMLDKYLAARGLPRSLARMFDYLTRGEFYYMRVSPIDGTGNTKAESEDAADEPMFLDLDPTYPTNPGLYAKQLGTPDIMYFTSGGDIDFSDADSSTYDQLSSNMSYIKPAEGEIVLIDWQNNADQFPQVPHDPSYSRQYQISLENYNNLTCNNVSEYRYYGFTDVMKPDGTSNSVGEVTRTWTIQPDYHPVYEYRGQTFQGKRGYFPPPVGHLRRYKGPIDGDFFGRPTDIFADNLSVDQQRMIGTDKPINDNLLPLSSVGDGPDEIGYYVHDIWDGSGFLFQLGADETTFTDDPPPKDNEEEPPATNPGDDISKPCEGAGCDDKPGTEVPIPCLPGGLCDGRAIIIDNSCGDYIGYHAGTLSAAPCGDFDVPLDSIARVVKRASDSFSDTCTLPSSKRLPTLWEQKNQYNNGAFQYPAMSANNIYIKSIYNDRPQTVSDMLSGLSDYADLEQGVLSLDHGFIDMDVINDMLILKQSPTQNDVTQSYIIDKMQFDYDTGKLKLGQFATHHVLSDSGPASQLLSHYYNEDENHVIFGVTRKYAHNMIVPELYRLDLNEESWSKVYPAPMEDVEQFRVRSEHVGGDYTISKIDPGEISYNPVTNNYSVTYFAELEPSDDNLSTMAIVIHRFENTTNGMKHVESDIYHSENKNISVDTVTELTTHELVKLEFNEGGGRGPGLPAQSSITVPVSSSSLELELDIKDLVGTPDSSQAEVMPLKMAIDWGDGENVVVYSDIYSSGSGFRRYGPEGSTFKLSDNTIMTVGFDSVGTSLTRHNIKHVYRFENEQPITATVNCLISDFTTTYSNTIVITPDLPEISTGIDNIKLLNTRLYSKPDVHDTQYLLITMETQTPRHVVTNIIELPS